MASQSILEKEYVEQDRPYSQDELKNKRSQLYNKLKLSKITAEHKHCGHFYKVVKHGRKEKEILESKNNDSGNCSICWKLNKIKDSFLRERAKDLIHEYSNCFYNRPHKTFLTYDMLNLETVYYTWLYEDISFNQNRSVDKSVDESVDKSVDESVDESVDDVCLDCD